MHTLPPSSRDGRSARRRIVIAVVVASALTACSGGSGDSDETPSTADTAFVDEDETAGEPFDLVIDDETIIATEDGAIPPTTTEAPLEGPDVPPAPDAVDTTVAPVPLPPANEIERIISLSPTHTETLFALGLGQFVVGVDPNSDHPAEAIALQAPGLDDSTSFIDPILALSPDVVILGEDYTGLAGRLNAAGVATFTGPPAFSLDEIYAQIRGIADIVARPDLGEDLVAGMQRDVEAIRDSIAGAGRLTYFHEIDPSYYTYGAASFITGLYAELGITNITDETLPGVQLFEADVIAADPDVIILGDVDCCGTSIDTLGNRPGWSSLSAVRDGAVVELSDPLYSRWGPRVVEMLRLVAGGIAAAS